jgi:hypothetical protein
MATKDTLFSAHHIITHDETCTRVTELTRDGDTIQADTYWREGGIPTSGSAVAAMARSYVGRGETITRDYTTAIPLPGGLRMRTVVYTITRTDNPDTDRN